MKVLVLSYNIFAQNVAGGVYSKVMNYLAEAKKMEYHVKPFDMWSDKIGDYDIVHYFTLKPEFYEHMMLAKKMGKKVVISSIVSIREARKIKQSIFLGKYLKIHNNFDLQYRMLSIADAIITETQKEKKFIISTYGIQNSKIQVIPNGVSVEIANGNPSILKEKINIQKDCILQVGRFDRNKNQLAVIRAMKDSGLPMVFVGGPDPSQLNYYKQCQYEAGANCYFLGWLDHSSPLMASAYAAAKVVVLPSHHEIFGNAIFEGALTGANIVATNALPIKEWGYQNHIISINPNDIQDIKKGIMKAYDAPRDVEFSQHIQECYSFKTIVNEHIAIYKSLL